MGKLCINFYENGKESSKRKMKASNNLKLAAASIEQTLNAEVAQAKFLSRCERNRTKETNL